MDRTTRKNFKAFQTPPGVSDPVRPDREPQKFPGAQPPEIPAQAENLNHLQNPHTEEELNSFDSPELNDSEKNIYENDENFYEDHDENDYKEFSDDKTVHEDIDTANDADENTDPHDPDTEDEDLNDYSEDYDDEDEYEENDIHSWFSTFMCMNIPIYGWIYLRRLASGQIPAPLEQQDFAEAYLYYKRFFLKISAVILIVLIIIGGVALNKLLAYMQML